MIKQVIAVALVLGLFISCEKVVEPVQTIQVSFSNDIGQESVDGRLLLMLSSDDSDEPRFQINDGLNTQLIFGMNVENWVQDSILTFDNFLIFYKTLGKTLYFSCYLFISFLLIVITFQQT